MILEPNDLILFQGDSITDACRNYEDINDLSRGYAFITAATLLSSYPELNLRFINKGVSGDRAVQLQERWKKDCLDLKPQVLSLLIGVNDTWRRFDRDLYTSAEDYAVSVRDILNQAKDNGVRDIVMIEPFLIEIGEDRWKWREDLNEKIYRYREIAREFGAYYVPMDGIFAQACTRQRGQYWSLDGVHPTPAGHALMAQAWLDTVGL